MLFDVLHPDIFMLFSGANRHLYEEVLVKVYDTWIRADLLFPTQTEVVSLIYDVLAERPALWRDDETPVSLDQVRPRGGRRLRRRRAVQADEAATSEAMARARHIYARLVQTGWLEESRYGLRVTVDMPAGAMRLIEFLCLLREGVSEELGGLVIEVKTAIEAVRLVPRDNALGLHKAARDAAAFGRYLRSVLSALRNIDRQILASENLERRLKHYFEDFVGRVLLKDYASILTTSHPYRFRHRIFEALHTLEDSAADIQILSEAYLDARLETSLAGARDLVFDDLLRVRQVFDRVEDAFTRIQQHRGRLEARLRNTVRYAGRRTGAFLQRSEHIVLKLDHALQSGMELAIEGQLETLRGPLSPQLLARARGGRAPIDGGLLLLRPADPFWELRKQLERAYLDRLAVRPDQVARFLEQRVAPAGETTAAHFWIGDADDFLAFEALRLAVPQILAGETGDALARRLLKQFEFARAPDDPVDNEWLSCSGFRVRRKDDHKTLEDGGAA